MTDFKNITDEQIVEVAQQIINEGNFENWLYIETGGKQGKLPGEEKTQRFRFPSNDDVVDFSTAIRYCTQELNKMFQPTIPTLFDMNKELRYRVFSSIDSEYPTQVLHMNELNWNDPNYTSLKQQYISIAPIAVYVECYEKNTTSFSVKDGIGVSLRVIKNIFKEKFPQFSVIVTEYGERYLPKDLIKDCRRQLVDRTQHKNPQMYERQNIYVILKGISSIADIIYENDGIIISEDDNGVYITCDNYNGQGKKSFKFDNKERRWKHRKGGGIPVLSNKTAATQLAKIMATHTNIPIKELLQLHYRKDGE
jgi:hypothetical protein